MKYEYSGANYKSVQLICYSLLHLERLRLPDRLSALEAMGYEPETSVTYMPLPFQGMP